MNMKTYLSILLILLFSVLQAEPRIVSMAPALTELLFLLGQGKYLVGRSEVCDYPAEVRNLPVTGRFGDPELERTLQLKPTLLLANDLVRSTLAGTFRKAGVKVLLKQCRNLEDYCAWVELLGKELHCQEKAEKELKRIMLFRKECAVQNRKITKPKKVLWVIWDSPVMVAGKGSLPDEVIRLSGAVNAAGNVPQEYFKASREWILSNPPDVILWSASKKQIPSLRSQFWNQLKSVQKKRVIVPADQNILQRPGPRLTEGIRFLRKALEVLP